MKRTGAIFVVVLIAACSLMRGGFLYAQPGAVDKEKALKVKATYLLRFPNFVTWPAHAFQDDHSPIIIGIVGDDPFGPLLDQTIKDKTVSGRPLQIQRIPWRAGDDVAAVKKCHLLYVSSSLGNASARLIVALANAPILIVGEGAEFAKNGGILGFILEEGRIVFWANKKAADAAKLQLSSQLLKLARPPDGAAVTQNPDAPKGTRGD